MSVAVPQRSAIPREHRWNAESVFATPDAWEAAVTGIVRSVPPVKSLQGKLSAGPQALLSVLAGVEDLLIRVGHVVVYAGFAYSVDTRDQAAAAMNGRAQAVNAEVQAAVSFLGPELLAVGQETLAQWIKVEERLAAYSQYIANLFRRQAHVRSAEVEEVLGMLSDPFAGPSTTATMLANADFHFAPAIDSRGAQIDVTQGTLSTILANPDRAARRSAWESYTDLYVSHRNTFAANLSHSIKQNVFKARTRRHATSLEAALFADAIPDAVFHNVLSQFRRNLPVWHRYFALRARVLKLPDQRHYDMWAPLSDGGPAITYNEAVDLICAGLAPLGGDYVAALRRGCREERWVDVYPNQGKRNGAFSWGSFGTHPFVMMSFTDDVGSLSTLAHELGHSMHSYLSWKTQPYVSADYSIFVAEVASNFHQAMVRSSLLSGTTDAGFQIAVLEEAMANFFRYFFIMPILGLFELSTHQRVEKGEALTADAMDSLMADLLTEGYGPGAKVDRQRDGMLWATFPHLFEDYYVYQYATGIAGANALAGRVLRGEPGAAESYKRFLSSGSSEYPLDILRKAGVDLTRPEPMEQAFTVMSSYVDRLEKLLP